MRFDTSVAAFVVDQKNSFGFIATDGECYTIPQQDRSGTRIFSPIFATSKLGRNSTRRSSVRCPINIEKLLNGLHVKLLNAFANEDFSTGPKGQGSVLMNDTEKTGEKQRGKPFQPGQSGNPQGRPRGALNKTTLALRAIMAEQAEAVVETLINQALAGDVAACRAILERLVPVCRESPIDEGAVALPPLTGENLPKAAGAVVEAVAGGALTPSQGQALVSMLDGFRKSVELAELEKRIAALEGQGGTK